MGQGLGELLIEADPVEDEDENTVPNVNGNIVAGEVRRGELCCCLSHLFCVRSLPKVWRTMSILERYCP